MPDDLNPDSFMAGLGANTPPPAKAELNPDSFMASQQTQPTAVPVPPAVHPMLADLPQPHEAVANAETKAQQTVQAISQAGELAQQPQISAEPHPILGRIREAFLGPNTALGTQSTLANPGDKTGKPTVDLGALIPPTATGTVANFGRGVAEGVSGFTSPNALGALAALGPVGKLPAVGRLVSAGFAADMIKGLWDQGGAFKKAVQAGDYDTAAKIAGQAAVTATAAGFAAHHALKGAPPAPALEGQALPPEQAPVSRRLAGDVAVEPPAVGKQPLGTPPGAAPRDTSDIDNFMRQQREAKKPAAPSTASMQQIDLTPDQFMATETKAAQPETKPPAEAINPQKVETTSNDNGSSIPVDRVEQPQPEAQGQGSGIEQGATPQEAQTQPARTVAGSSAGTETTGQQESGALEQTPARAPQVSPAYGNETTVRVPGEQTSYPAKYAVREASDVQPSHNPFSFEANPAYHYQNDRDYSQPENAARVIGNGQPGTYDPGYTLTPAPTAEHGAPVIDPNGNALGGNSRTMTQQRVYEHNQAGADAYRQRLAQNAADFGIDPNKLGTFKNPMLVRELQSQPTKVGAQNAITDFNKTAAAKLAPEEQAVSDGRRLSPRTIDKLSGNLADVGDDSTLAQALKGDKGDDVLESLVTDGVLTRQEKGGMLDERGQLTPAAKDRIGKALVGRLYDAPADYARSAPETRTKLEKIAPQVLRVEDRPEWSLTQPVRDAVNVLADAKAHGTKNLADLAKQSTVGGARTYSPEALAIAKKLQENPNAAAKAFRQYANDAELSREGAQVGFFEPPTKAEAFESAFGAKQPQQAQAVASRLRQPIPLPEAEHEVYKTRQSSGYHAVRMKAQEIALPPEHAEHVRAVALNISGMETIGRMSGHKMDQAARGIGGAFLSPPNAAVVARNLAAQLSVLSAHKPAGMIEMQRVAQEAADSNKAVVVVALRHGQSPQLMQQILLEELNHAAQNRLAGPNAPALRHLGSSALPFSAGPVGRKASRTLSQNGYNFRTAGEAAGEIGVRLMDPGRHTELGLTLPEARSLGAEYVRALRKEYGHARPKEIIRQVTEALRRSDRSQHEQSGELSDRVGSGGRGGPSGATGQDLRSTPTDAGTPTELPRKLSESPTGARELRLASEPGQPSLFTDSEKKTIADTSASDRAKLEGQRLTAQMKAPLTREEQVKKLKKPKNSQTDLFDKNEEPLQGTLFNRLAKQSDEDPAKANYSGLGALEDVTTRNLSQLRRADPVAWAAAVKAASSKSQASVLIKTAMPLIEKAMKGDHSLEEFRTALIESRLQGIQQRWSNLADMAERATPRQLQESAPRLLPLLGHVEDRTGFGRNLEQTAASLLEKEDYPTLQKMLTDTFSRAADNVTHVLTPEAFNDLRHSPSFQDGLGIYKKLLEKPMAQSHESNEGIFSDALGPLNTYYPLVPVEEGEVKRLRTASKPEYSRPKNLMNNFATGLSENYDSSMESFRDKMTAAVKANNKAAFMDSLVEQGMVAPLKPFERAGDRILYRGQEFEAVRMETTPARVIVQGGKTTHLPPSAVLVPKWLEKELEPVLQNKFQSPTLGTVRKIASLANEIAISGPADFVFHSANLFGTLVANTPFLGNSLLGKAASLPLLKRFTSVVKVATMDPTTEEAAGDLREMATLGILPDRFGSETYSKKYAEMTGAKLRRFSAGPLLNGPKGIDVRARLVMYRLAKEINPGASGPQLHAFTNQLGNYVDSLQSQLERSAKHIGLSPFATAGTTMLRNGINAWTGAGPMPSDAPSLRIWQQLTGGAVCMVALWALTQKQYTGKWPWQDKRSKLLQIPINPADRHSKLGQHLWGKGPETGYVNFSFFNPLVGRGARALGIKGAADTAMQGGKWWQDLEAAQRDVMNSYAHPFLGPIPRAAFVGLTGDEPYLTGLRDDRAKFNPQLMPAVRNPGQGSSVLKRAGAAAKELNSFYGNVAANSGLGETNNRDSTDHWARMVFDLALPGLVANGQNPAKQATYVRRQAAAAKRQR